LAYSTNGVNWTGTPGNTTLFGSGNAATYNYYQNLWMAGGNGTTYKFAYSKDAYTWTGIASATSAFTNVRGLAYSSTLWVACGDGTDTLAYSKDGFTWTGLGSAIHTNGTYVAYSSTQALWTATGYGTNKISYSKDGVTWTGITGSTIFSSYGMEIAYSNKQNIWTAVGGYSTNTIAYSTNGFNWTGIPGNTGVLGEIGWAVGYSEGQNLWIAGGQTANSLGYSSNGYNWTTISGSATIISLVDSIKYSAYDNLWIAGGNAGTANTLAYSTNGINWTGLGKTLFNSNITAIACNDQGPPILYYPFNGDILNYASGAGVSDITAGTANLIASDPAGGAGKSQNIALNSAYFLDRSGAITLPSTIGSGFTITFWVNNNNAGATSYDTMCGFGSSSTNNLFGILDNHTAAPLSVYISGTYYSWTCSEFIVNSWQHIACVVTCTDSVGTYRMDTYLNGVVLSPSPTGSNAGLTPYSNLSNSCSYHRIGAWVSTSFPHAGLIDNYRFYNRALNAGSIYAIYNAKA